MSHPILRYGFGETVIGIVSVAISGAGVASILIGDDREGVCRELTATWPGSVLVEDQDAVAGTIRDIREYLADPRGTLDLALDVKGSDAERAVWSALRAIPAGETRSYGQIAKALPVPMTAQEVGAACAANVLALAIPCHRIVKADGGISGYRWGVARKRRLLRLEATI